MEMNNNSQSQGGMMGQNITCETLRCAYCHGTGKDCANDCPVCSGLGYNKMGRRPSYEEEEHKLKSGATPEPCGFCSGNGREFTSTCSVCKGSGRVMVVQPSHKCITCQGTGKEGISHCTGCFGTGWACSMSNP